MNWKTAIITSYRTKQKQNFNYIFTNILTYYVCYMIKSIELFVYYNIIFMYYIIYYYLPHTGVLGNVTVWRGLYLDHNPIIVTILFNLLYYTVEPRYLDVSVYVGIEFFFLVSWDFKIPMFFFLVPWDIETPRFHCFCIQ